MTDPADIPEQITTYLHCGKCIDELMAKKKGKQSPRSFARLSIGLTKEGFVQIWCVRHNINVGILGDEGEIDGDVHQPK